MSKIQFRLLKPSEIEVRRSYAKKDGDNLYLLFIDSRSVVKLLDETVGAMNWQTDFYEVNGQMFGKLGIWDDDKNQWVWKSDVGSETNIEAQKGAVSDCYKRLLARWGVTELYTAPKIRIDNPNKYTNYYVSSISYTDDRCICALQLVDKFGNVVFDWTANGYGDDIEIEIPQQYSEPVEVKGFAPQQTLTEPQQQKLIKLPNPLTDQGMLDKRLYAQIMKAPDKESLINIYNIYSELKNNKFFVSTLQKRKSQLGIPS